MYNNHKKKLFHKSSFRQHIGKYLEIAEDHNWRRRCLFRECWEITTSGFTKEMLKGGDGFLENIGRGAALHLEQMKSMKWLEG